MVAASGIETFFLVCDTYNFKIYQDSMTQTSDDFFLGQVRPPW